MSSSHSSNHTSSFPAPLRTMDDSILRSVGWKEEPHLLRSKWHMWYHNTINKDYSKSSFVDLFPKPIESLEEMILLFNSWDEALPEANQGMFYLMREMKTGAIYPCREDPHNARGGYWTCKIDTEKAAEVWKKLCFLMVNEQVVEDWKKINGVSITPKHGFCLVKIWNRLDDECDVTQLKTYMSNFLDLDKVMYFNNKIKIAIDSKRQQHHNHTGSRRHAQQAKGKERRRPQRQPMQIHRSNAKTNSPFGGALKKETGGGGDGWRHLLRQQSSQAKPGSVYQPPVLSMDQSKFF